MRRARNLAVDTTATVIAVLVWAMAAGAGLDTGTLSEERFLLGSLLTVPAVDTTVPFLVSPMACTASWWSCPHRMRCTPISRSAPSTLGSAGRSYGACQPNA